MAQWRNVDLMSPKTESLPTYFYFFPLIAVYAYEGDFRLTWLFAFCSWAFYRFTDSDGENTWLFALTPLVAWHGNDDFAFFHFGWLFWHINIRIR